MATAADVYQALTARATFYRMLDELHHLRPHQERHMPSITEILDGLKDQLTNDPLVAAAVSSVITPEGRTLLASVVAGLADLEAKHTADKQAAVEAAKAEATAAAQPPAEPQA